jgi:hypothetical protein
VLRGYRVGVAGEVGQHSAGVTTRDPTRRLNPADLARLTRCALGRKMYRHASPDSSQGGTMRARFLGKDPNSQEGQSPTLFATERTDRKTYIAQGWVMTDPQALADVGPVPEGETIIEIPEDVLRFFERRDQEGYR